MRIIKVFSFLLMAAALASVGWFARGIVKVARDRSKSSSAQESVAVAVTAATNVVFNPPVEFIGHVEPMLEVDVLPQIEGYLTAVRFREGARVEQGDVLFEIDPERYAAERKLRLAEIEKAKGEVGVADAEVARAQRFVSRMQTADERGVTRTDIDNAEAALATAKASLAAAQSGVAQAEANLALADFNLKHTKILAPFAGRIGKALRHDGDYVSPGKGALARIVQTDPVRVAFPVTDREFVAWCEERGTASDGEAAARLAKRVRLVLPNGREYSENGEWDFMANEMDAATATLELRVLFPNPMGVLLANAFVTVRVDDTKPKTVVAIPSSAVIRDATGTTVWVLGADGRPVRREIAAGRSWRGLTEVVSGLEGGESVIFQGVQKVSADKGVRVVPATVFE